MGQGFKGKDMRIEQNKRLDKYRVQHPTRGDSDLGANWGYFIIKRHGYKLYVISSGSGEEWEHVSASRKNRTPSWGDMCFIKNLFWGDEETVIQFHPPRSRYYNLHPHVLHLWKPTGVEYNLPPVECL
jgi:hypothetical protein